MKQPPSRPLIGYYPQQQPTPPPRKPKIDPVRLAALVMCVCVFFTCFFLLCRYAYNILISRGASRQLEEMYVSVLESEIPLTEAPTPTATQAPTPTQTPVPTATRVPATATPAAARVPTVSEIWPTSYPDNPTLRVSSIFVQLQAQNKDIVGWLKIDGILEEAVVQRDNSYYLTHNALRQKSVTGALFLDENCKLNNVPTQMVIHGHNMKEGAMFGALKKYKVKDSGFYREHPFIDFNTIYENGRYVIFAVAEVDIRAGKPDHLPFWYYSRFTSADAFMQYVDRARLLSFYRCNVDVQPGDRLLTLSTCTGNDENKRLIVMARKLRPDENELELSISIHSTTDK